MVELSTLAKYPFLNAAKTYVKDNSLSVEELLDDPLYDRARTMGVERLVQLNLIALWNFFLIQ